MENQTFRMPMIGDNAPSFVVETTQGTLHFPEDFGGKWVILFGHPGDFTPVCTSEFVLFGAMQEEFEQLNCKLVGLSIGSTSSHIAWLRSIEQNISYRGYSNVKIRFPLIADLSMEVARSYGMVAPRVSATKAVRSVFFIDPDGVIRAIVSYPMQLGRNFRELKRILIGLQVIDHHKVALPADWLPGDDIVVGAPTTYEGEREPIEGMTCYDWYFCLKPLHLKEKEYMKDMSL